MASCNGCRVINLLSANIIESLSDVRFYGGTPYYLQTIDPNKPLAENVSQSILSEQRLLHTEPEFLLRTEL